MPKKRNIKNRERRICSFMMVCKDETFTKLMTTLGLPQIVNVESEVRADVTGKTQIKMDFAGELEGGRSFAIEYQVGKANLDHAKALIYPLIASKNVGVWIATDFPEYLKVAVKDLNATYKGRCTFYLVKASHITAIEAVEMERQVKGMDFQLVC